MKRYLLLLTRFCACIGAAIFAFALPTDSHAQRGDGEPCSGGCFYADYAESLELLENYYREGDFESLAKEVAHAEKMRVHEIATYKHELYVAILVLEEGNLAEGKQLLDRFEIKLLVNAGAMDCPWQEQLTSPPIVEQECHFMGLVSMGLLEHIVEYWHKVVMVRRKYLSTGL